MKFPNGKNIISHRFEIKKSESNHVKSVFICVQYKLFIDKIIISIHSSCEQFEGLLCNVEISIIENKWFSKILNKIFSYTKIIQNNSEFISIYNKFLLFLYEIKINKKNKTVDLFHRNLFFLKYQYFIDSNYSHCLKSGYKKKNCGVVSYYHENKFYDMIMLEKKSKVFSIEQIFNYIDLKEVKYLKAKDL